MMDTFGFYKQQCSFHSPFFFFLEKLQCTDLRTSAITLLWNDQDSNCSRLNPINIIFIGTYFDLTCKMYENKYLAFPFYIPFYMFIFIK